MVRQQEGLVLRRCTWQGGRSVAPYPLFMSATAIAAGTHYCMCLVQNQELELQYKTCYARILDAKRRFLEAATRYYDLSQIDTHINGRMVSGNISCATLYFPIWTRRPTTWKPCILAP